jgi:hypothetical protein
MVGLAGLLVALVVPLLPAAPPYVPELELSAGEAAPGDEVGVSGRGFAGCIPRGTTDTPEPQSEGGSVDPPPLVEPPPVILRWESLKDPQSLGEATLDDEGSFSTTITVPAGAGAEPFYEVSASCSSGPGSEEVFESAVIVVVAPPPPTTPPTRTPPTTTPRTSAPTSTPEPPPTESPPTPIPTSDPAEPVALEVTSSGSDVLLAALAAALVVGIGLLGLTRVLRRRNGRHSRAPSVVAVAAPAAPGLLDVHPRGPERTVALRVVMRAEPGALSVHRSKE